MQSGGVSEAFRELANVLEALETTAHQGVEITTATPVEDELLDTDTVSIDVGVQVPFLEDPLDTENSETTLTPTDVHLEDTGTLRIDFQATVIQSATESSQLHDDQSAETENTSANPNSNATRTPATNDRKHSEDTTPSDPATAEETTTQYESGSAENRQIHSQSADSTETTQSTDTTTPSDQDTSSDQSQPPSLPPYQDPERLQAVYEQYDTFAEMTDALDVDVTPQTVRRYMIEYDIHEPASTTGSQLAETLLETDSESLSTTDNTSDSDDTDSPAPLSPSSPTEDHHSEPHPQAQNDEDLSSTDNGTHDSETPSDASTTDTKPTTQPSRNESQTDEVLSDETDTEHDEHEQSSSGAPAERNSELDHPPSSDDPDASSIDKAALEAAVETDLPSHITIDDVIEVTRTAKTLYDAQHQFGVNRERTRDLLQDLNLLELVHGRIANRATERPSLEEIEKRIWNSVPTQNDTSASGQSPVHAHANN